MVVWTPPIGGTGKCPGGAYSYHRLSRWSWRSLVILADYQYLSLRLRELFGNDNRNIYWGDQGLLSASFVGDVRYYGFPEIRNLWYMPYNFCLWYYDRMNEKPNYYPAILHFAGTAFKPWNGSYPIFLNRFQKKQQLRLMNELRNGQAGYFYLWHEYAIMADPILDKIGF